MASEREGRHSGRLQTKSELPKEKQVARLDYKSRTAFSLCHLTLPLQSRRSPIGHVIEIERGLFQGQLSPPENVGEAVSYLLWLVIHALLCNHLLVQQHGHRTAGTLLAVLSFVVIWGAPTT